MKISFSKIQSRSVRAQVAYEIESKIFSGELKNGDRLPPSRELASAMGVSRSILDLAILDLEAKGFLRIVPRKGTFVRDYQRESTPQMLLSLIHHGPEIHSRAIFLNVSEMRLLLETECARLAADNASDENMSALEKAFADMKTFTYEGRSGFVEANFRFHYEVCIASGNIVYAMIFKSFEQSLRYYLEKAFDNEEHRAYSVKRHRRLLDAIRTRDAGRAEKEMRTFMRESIEIVTHVFENDKSENS